MGSKHVACKCSDDITLDTHLYLFSIVGVDRNFTHYVIESVLFVFELYLYVRLPDISHPNLFVSRRFEPQQSLTLALIVTLILSLTPNSNTNKS